MNCSTCNTKMNKIDLRCVCTPYSHCYECPICDKEEIDNRKAFTKMNKEIKREKKRLKKIRRKEREKNIINPIKTSLEYYKNILPQSQRITQLNKIAKIIHIENNTKIECIETGASSNILDGCIGLFLAKLCKLTHGNLHSVDNNIDITNKSKMIYQQYGFNIQHYTEDSVKFLENTDVIPNILHLDSCDLNLKNPFPSTLHCWREFIGIENKMPPNSYIIIDDNFFKGTSVEWNYFDNATGKQVDSENLLIEYPIIGKGSMVYHFVESGESQWEKISTDEIGPNNKLIFKKKGII